MSDPSAAECVRASLNLLTDSQGARDRGAVLKADWLHDRAQVYATLAVAISNGALLGE